jgi:hypothetical protein
MDSPDPLYHPVPSVPAATPLPDPASDQALGAKLVLRPGGQPSPDAVIAAGLLARARAGLPVLDGIEPRRCPMPSRYEAG